MEKKRNVLCIICFLPGLNLPYYHFFSDTRLTYCHFFSRDLIYREKIIWYNKIHLKFIANFHEVKMVEFQTLILKNNNSNNKYFHNYNKIFDNFKYLVYFANKKILSLDTFFFYFKNCRAYFATLTVMRKYVINTDIAHR